MMIMIDDNFHSALSDDDYDHFHSDDYDLIDNRFHSCLMMILIIGVCLIYSNLSDDDYDF